MIFIMDIYANSINEENKYETLYKETAKIEISNKDIAQKYMMTWVNKFSNDTQELNDTTMVTYKETIIEKAKMIETLGEKATIEILNDEIKFTSAAKAAFQSVDTDNSGEIDLNELKAVMDSMASVQMLLSLQEKFDIDVPVSEFNRAEWDTPNKIVAKVESLENE